MAKAERVEWGGKVWRRYPDSPRRELRVYFAGPRGKRLHVAIWEDANGPVPSGHEIHHRDENPLNNALENLECVLASEHRKHHSERNAERGVWKPGLALAREAARAWHGSDAGRAWHSRNSKAAWLKASWHDHVCSVCGAGFRTRTPRATICSANCHTIARRRSGVDDIDKSCAHCGKLYRANRYARATHCSRSCATSHRYAAERARLQRHG